MPGMLIMCRKRKSLPRLSGEPASHDGTLLSEWRPESSVRRWEQDLSEAVMSEAPYRRSGAKTVPLFSKKAGNK